MVHAHRHRTRLAVLKGSRGRPELLSVPMRAERHPSVVTPLILSSRIAKERGKRVGHDAQG